MRFYHTPTLLQLFTPGLVWRKPVGSKTIYLTFDDGPIPEVTDYVLNTLAEYGAKATFFWVGENVQRHPEIAQRVLAAGHRAGNHTHNHLDGWRNPPALYVENISQCQAAMEAAVPAKALEPLLFRPPYGKIAPAQLRALRSRYKVVMWDVLSYDFDNRVAPELGLAQSIKHTRPGSIVLFHDSLKARANMEFMLPRYLAHFQQQGYTFAAL